MNVKYKKIYIYIYYNLQLNICKLIAAFKMHILSE